MRRFLLLLPLALTLFPGCAGYTLGPVKPKRWADVKTVAVTNFKNLTLEPRVEVLLANAVIKQLQQDGTFRVTDEAHADAILEGQLETIDRRPSRSVTGNFLLAREYTLNLRGRYEFKRRNTGEMLDARGVNGSTSFFVTGSTIISADVNQDERQAIPNAALDLAVHLVARFPKAGNPGATCSTSSPRRSGISATSPRARWRCCAAPT